MLNKSNRNAWIAIAGLVVASLSSSEARAQFFSPEEALSESIKRRDSLALKDSEVGDIINLVDGSVVLEQADIEIPGNSKLEVSLKRRISLTSTGNLVFKKTGFGDWNIVLPRISTVSVEWINSHPTDKLKRCSVNDLHYTAPPQYDVKNPQQNSDKWHVTPAAYWSAPTLDIPSDSGVLLVPNDNSLLPLNDQSIKWVTKSRAIISCLPQIKNGTGEGFTATTPDGLKYRFDWISTALTTPLMASPMTPWFNLSRYEFSLYATRVEDQFGNWVEYDFESSKPDYWGARLKAIRSNDGRKIEVAYDESTQLIKTASANGKIWSYSYVAAPSDPTLKSVALPDGSKYQFEQVVINQLSQAPGRPGNCLNNGTINSPGDYSRWFVTPSGLKTTFVFKAMLFGRSNVPKACETGGSTYLLSYPAYALIRKTREGPGIEAQIWNYSYSSQFGFAPFIGSNTATVTEPDSSKTFYTYGNTFEQDDGLLTKVEKVSAGNVSLFTKSISYGLPGGVVGVRVGISPQGWIASTFELRTRLEFNDETIRPENLILIQQQGRTFSEKVEEFDALLRPARITRSSY